jgi:hypothetical protein
MSSSDATTTTSTSKRSSSSSSSSDAGTVVTDYDTAIEVGYFGGPIDETDYTVAGVIAAAEAAKAEASG